jgi:PhnB protein
MTSHAKTIPDGYGSVTPSLVVRDARKAIEFYKKAFGAKERMRIPGPDGNLMHAELQVGDSIVMLADEMPDVGCKAPASVGATSSSLYVYVPDVDAAFERAVEAGAKALMPPSDMFWGDRFGTVEDPSGHRWGLATHKEDPSPAEMEKRQTEFFASMAQQKKGH